MFRLWRHPTAGGAAWPPRLGQGSAEAAGPRAGRWENSFPPHPCCHHLRVIPVSVNGANPHRAGEDEHLNLLFALLPTSGPSAESISKPSTSSNPSAAGLVHARVLSPGELWRSPQSLHTLFPAPRPEIHSARCAYPTNQIILAAFQRLPWEAAPAIFSHHPLLFLPTAQITAGYFMSLQLISPNASAMREGGPASLEHGFIQNAQRNAAA